MKKDLSIVMPVYNEEECISAVVAKWVVMLDNLNITYDLNVFNDGSKDKTLATLKSIEGKFPNLVVNDKPNSGHGPTILLGYRNSANYTWLFQIDSDDELGPESFPKLWEKREDYDFLIGIRSGRYSPLPRKVISFISRIVVWAFYGTGVYDVNCPYRLMRNEKFRDTFQQIPDDTFAPNLIVSGMTARLKLRVFQMPVAYKDRQTGEVSIKKWKLLKVAMKSFWQSIFFAIAK